MQKRTGNGQQGDSRLSIGAAALNDFRRNFYAGQHTRAEVAKESGNSYSCICNYLQQGRITAPHFNNLMAALMAVDSFPPKQRR